MTPAETTHALEALSDAELRSLAWRINAVLSARERRAAESFRKAIRELDARAFVERTVREAGHGE